MLVQRCAVMWCDLCAVFCAVLMMLCCAGAVLYVRDEHVLLNMCSVLVLCFYVRDEH